jgi:prepilin-type N-terminal cleavage/methylation domain-containing protein
MKKAMKQGFSLIELMIVVVIIGALTAIILPQFNMSETEAKDAGCDASNYGTLRQLINFKSVNGVYPSRLHTGFEDETSADAVAMGATAGAAALADVTAYNLTNETATVNLSANQAASLNAAGIDIIAAGGFGVNAVFTEVTNNVAVRSIDQDWFEGFHDDGSVDTDTAVTINGLPIFAYASADPQLDYEVGNAIDDLDDVDGIVVPLFAAPTADWGNAVVDGASMESKVGVAQAGGCPWLEAGDEFRYYITFFKVFNNGDAAKLIGTACPECGSLNP